MFKKSNTDEFIKKANQVCETGLISKFVCETGLISDLVCEIPF